MGASGKATRWRIVADTHRSCSPYVIKIARGATTPLARSTPGLVPSPKQTMVLFPRNAISAGACGVGGQQGGSDGRSTHVLEPHEA